MASLKKRAAFKLAANLLGALAGFANQAIAARGLGPAALGDFSYITSLFWQIVGFLNLNTSTAFYAKLSQRPDEVRMVRFYFVYVALVLVGTGLFAALALATGLGAHLWSLLSGRYVAFGAAWAGLMFLLMIIGGMADSYGMTVKAETVKSAAKAAGFFVLIAISLSRVFSLTSFFLYQLAFIAIPTLLIARLIRKERGAVVGAAPRAGAARSFGSYAEEFKAFCFPLVAFNMFSVVEQALDRWLVQRFTGSVGQGYFALSNQVGSLSLVFTSSLLPLLFRESAIAHSEKDLNRQRDLISRAVPLLSGVSMFVCVFSATQSGALVDILGGENYSDAAWPMFIMCFFPIHQTLGQLAANLFFATDRVNLYRNIGLGFTVVGALASLFLLGPKSHGCLQWGAAGLAVKMVAIQVVSVNVQLYFMARAVGASFGTFLKDQLVPLGVFAGLSMLSSLAASQATSASGAKMSLAVSALFYAAGVSVLALAAPGLLGFRKSDLRMAWDSGRRFLQGGKTS